MKRIVAIALAAVMAFGMVSVGLADGGGPVAVWDGSGSSDDEESTTSNTDSKDTTVTTGELGEVYEWTLPSDTTLSGDSFKLSGSVTATVTARLDSTNCIKLTAENTITMTNDEDDTLSFDCSVSNGEETDNALTANGSDGVTVCEGGGAGDEGTFYLFGDCYSTGTYTGSLTITAAIATTPTTNIPNGGGTNAIA